MEQPHLPLLLQIFSLSLALFGSFLGVLNAWASWTRDRVNLKVVPKGYIPTRGGVYSISSPQENNSPAQRHICIEIANLGFIPVTIDEVGFLLENASKGRLAITKPLIIDGGSFPRRLEPRASFVAYAAEDSEGKTPFHRVTKAYAQTACGVVSTGTSPFLKNLIKISRQKFGISRY